MSQDAIEANHILCENGHRSKSVKQNKTIWQSRERKSCGLDVKPEVPFREGQIQKEKQMRKIQIVIMAATACALVTCPVANASLTISGSVGGAPTGVNKVNFDDLTLGSIGGTATGPSGTVGVSFVTDGQAVAGAVGGQYAMPWLSGGNGTGFGAPNQPNGQDVTTYLTSGISDGTTFGAAILTFSTPLHYIGLLWGSVDSYNTLSLYNGTTLVGTVTGSQVLASPNGDQGINGTLYVNITSTLAFDIVKATSTQYAFEFDNVAYSAVPEPTTMVAGAGALGLALLGIGRARRTSVVRIGK